MMRATASPETLQAIREELGISKFKAACRTRNRYRIELVKARRKYDRAAELLAYHRRLNNPHGVAKYAAELTFADTQIKTLERRIVQS